MGQCPFCLSWASWDEHDGHHCDCPMHLGWYWYDGPCYRSDGYVPVGRWYDDEDPNRAEPERHVPES